MRKQTVKLGSKGAEGNRRVVDICAGAQAHILPLGKLLGLAMKQVILLTYYTFYDTHNPLYYMFCVFTCLHVCINALLSVSLCVELLLLLCVWFCYCVGELLCAASFKIADELTLRRRVANRR